MKTEKEAKRIEAFLDMLQTSAVTSGNDINIKYDNQAEQVIVTGDKEIVINVHMDSVSATFRDVIRALGLAFN